MLFSDILTPSIPIINAQLRDLGISPVEEPDDKDNRYKESDFLLALSQLLQLHTNVSHQNEALKSQLIPNLEAKLNELDLENARCRRKIETLEGKEIPDLKHKMQQTVSEGRRNDLVWKKKVDHLEMVVLKNWEKKHGNLVREHRKQGAELRRILVDHSHRGENCTHARSVFLQTQNSVNCPEDNFAAKGGHLDDVQKHQRFVQNQTEEERHALALENKELRCLISDLQVRVVELDRICCGINRCVRVDKQSGHLKGEQQLSKGEKKQRIDSVVLGAETEHDVDMKGAASINGDSIKTVENNAAEDKVAQKSVRTNAVLPMEVGVESSSSQNNLRSNIVNDILLPEKPLASLFAENRSNMEPGGTCRTALQSILSKSSYLSTKYSMD